MPMAWVARSSRATMSGGAGDDGSIWRPRGVFMRQKTGVARRLDRRVHADPSRLASMQMGRPVEPGDDGSGCRRRRFNLTAARRVHAANKQVSHAGSAGVSMPIRLVFLRCR
jgi:hypothetical protein